MADKAPEFKPDVVGAIRLLAGAVAGQGATSPHGVHPNVARALALLDDPNVPDSPDPQSDEGSEADPPARRAKVAS